MTQVCSTFWLSTAWRSGEVRPTHQESTKPPRTWRTRLDPFESVWPRIQGWLEAEPDRTAKDLLHRLQLEALGTFDDGQLRTLQRQVKEWRQSAIRKLVFPGTNTSCERFRKLWRNVKHRGS